MMNKAIVDSKGRWLCPISVWNNRTDRSETGPAGAWCVVSEDNGKTYRPIGKGFTPPNTALFDEHSFVELNDGRLWLVNRMVKGMENFSPPMAEKPGRNFRNRKLSTLRHDFSSDVCKVEIFFWSKTGLSIRMSDVRK